MRLAGPFLYALRTLAGWLVVGLRSLSGITLEWSSRLLSISATFYRLVLASFSSLTGSHLIGRELLRQAYFTSIQGLHVFTFSALMLGFVVIVHATPKLVMLQGEEYVGWLLVTIVVRELGPVWAAFFVLLHSGSAITVEIGIMSVDREVEALKMLGIDPYRLLGVPRFWAAALSVVSLYILCGFTAILGGYLFSLIFAEIFWSMFWLSFINSLEWVDVALGISKCLTFGMLIASVSIFYGFQAKQSMDEVARLTSKASLTALVLCASLNIILTSVYYL